MEKIERKYKGAFTLAKRFKTEDIEMFSNVDGKTYVIFYDDGHYRIQHFFGVTIKEKTLEKTIDKMMKYLLR